MPRSHTYIYMVHGISSRIFGHVTSNGSLSIVYRAVLNANY